MSMRAVDDKEPDRDAPKWILEVPAGRYAKSDRDRGGPGGFIDT